VEARIMGWGNAVHILGLFLGPEWGHFGFWLRPVGGGAFPRPAGQRYPAVRGFVTRNGRTGCTGGGDDASLWISCGGKLCQLYDFALCFVIPAESVQVFPSLSPAPSLWMDPGTGGEILFSTGPTSSTFLLSFFLYRRRGATGQGEPCLRRSRISWPTGIW
jgi:hypothetical protein